MGPNVSLLEETSRRLLTSDFK